LGTGGRGVVPDIDFGAESFHLPGKELYSGLALFTTAKVEDFAFSEYT